MNILIDKHFSVDINKKYKITKNKFIENLINKNNNTIYSFMFCQKNCYASSLLSREIECNIDNLKENIDEEIELSKSCYNLDTKLYEIIIEYMNSLENDIRNNDHKLNTKYEVIILCQQKVKSKKSIIKCDTLNIQSDDTNEQDDKKNIIYEGIYLSAEIVNKETLFGFRKDLSINLEFISLSNIFLFID